MKGSAYAEEKQDHTNNNSCSMFAKLHQTQKFHHPAPLPQPQRTFHQPFHVSTRECQTSEEADSHSHSHQSRSPTTKKEGPSSTINDGATIEVVRRPRGRPPGSKNKPRPPVIITRETEPSMSPYVLELPGGVDIVDAVTSFCRKRNIGICIINGSGTVSNVTLRQPSTTPGATVTFHGRFDILSISATILASNTQTTEVFANGNGFTISLAGPQGQVFGGAVVGTLMSAGRLYLIAATFNSPSYHRLPLEDDESRNATSAGAGAGAGGNEGRHPSQPPASGGGGDGGVAIYSCHLPSDVIWAPTSRQPPPY